METATTYSEQQLNIFGEFETGKSHFAVEARAGTGKTFCIKIGITKAPEAAKVYLAFNKKNVLEAQAKIKDPRVQVMSLNGLGHRYVLAAWKGVRPDDSVESDRISAAIKANRVTARFQYAPFAIIKEIVAFAKNTRPFATRDDLRDIADLRGLEPEGYCAQEGWTTDLCCDIALASMQLAKTRDIQGRISFNDQIWLPVVMGWARARFDLVVVDECQDMNATQLILARRACRNNGRIVLVGDPRQAIYGFRGADVGGMTRLSQELGAKTFPLTATYRCPAEVVELAKKLVPDYVAAPGAIEGSTGSIRIESLQSRAVVGDAIISRSNAPLMGLCLGFIKRGIKAYIEGRDVGKTLLNIHGAIKARDIKTYIEAVNAWADAKLSRISADSDEASAARDKICDQADTLVALAEECNSVAEVGTALGRLFDDTGSNRAPAVVLSTVHKAKGLEWDRVFLIAATFKRCTWNSTVSEINNITYVAVTRAKKELVWVVED